MKKIILAIALMLGAITGVGLASQPAAASGAQYVGYIYTNGYGYPTYCDYYFGYGNCNGGHQHARWTAPFNCPYGQVRTASMGRGVTFYYNPWGSKYLTSASSWAVDYYVTGCTSN